MLSIFLFGQAHFIHDEKPFRLNAPPKTLPLWAYLLLHRERAILREQLAFTLWLDEPESAARTNLRRHIHHLQHALPPAPPERPWLVLDGDTVRWNPQADAWLDVVEFERLAADPGTLAQAVTLYTGELLSNLYDDWLIAERERLRTLYLGGLAQLTLAARSQGQYAQAAAYAQQILVRDPFREDALRQLIAVRYEGGDRAGALQEYEHFARRLRAEIGIDPMPETETLYAAIVRNARIPGTPAGQAAVAGPEYRQAGTRTVLPFAGREAEMERLCARWATAVRGHGGVVLTGGEAGIGKTRLARELALLVESQGARVLYGSTAPGEPRPYQAVAEALQSAHPLLSSLPFEPLRLAALATLLPEIKARRTVPALPALDPAGERARLFDALAVCLERLAEPRPVLLILEDFHWAGAASVALVEFLARRAAGRPLLILITYREEEIPRQHPLRDLRRLQREKLVDHLPLGRLSARAVATIAGQVLRDAPQAGHMAEHLHAASDGNPLFLDLLLCNWLETGEAPATGTPDLLAVIHRRLQRLSAQARALAEVAALCGTSFDVELVREVGGWNEACVAEGLGELLDGQIVQEAGGHRAYDYAFAHHLFQFVLYESIPEGRRARRHRRAAGVMASLYGTRLDDLAAEIARHLDLGGDAAQAVEFYVRAARRALAVYADEEALALLSRALEIHAGLDDPTARYELLALRETVYERRAVRDAQARDLDAMAALAESLDDDGRRVAVLLRRAAYGRLTGDFSGAIEIARRAIELAPRLATCAALPAVRPEAVVVSARLEIGRALESRGDFGEFRSTAEQALAEAQAAGMTALEAQCEHRLGRALVHLAQYATAFEHIQRALHMYHTLDDRRGEAEATSGLGVLLYDQAQLTQAREYQRQALALYQETGDRWSQAGVHNNLGAIDYDRGDYPQARRSFEEALALMQGIGEGAQEGVVLNNLAMVTFEYGDYDSTRKYLERALALCREREDPCGECMVLGNMSSLALECGEKEAAVDLAMQSLAIVREKEIGRREAMTMSYVAEALMALGRLDEAAGYFRTALALYRELGHQPNVAQTLACLADIARRQGNLPGAVDLIDQVLAHMERDGFDGFDNVAMVELLCYRVLHAAGDPRARSVLAASHERLQARARAIQDAEARRMFLQNVSYHRDVAALWQQESPM